MTLTRPLRTFTHLVLLTLCAASASRAADDLSAQGAPGDVEVAPFLLPPSSFASPEARAALAEMLNAPKPGDRPPADVQERRAQTEKQLQLRVDQARALYPVSVEAQTLGGVSVNVVQPAAGVAARNRRRVLIELAGGAFTTATPAGGVLESMPIAAIGGMRVVSVHYRQGPEARFPAASEDVAAVYTELLKQYRPSAIGIYGCSSGAYLTTMSLAWFQAHHLPRPGAVALLCGSAGRIFEGDSFFSAAAFMGHKVPLPITPEHPVVQVEYMRDVKDTDPLAMPINFPDVLKQFPPTLLITGTRDIALSTAVYLHTRLVQLGVTADLHVWDGMWHGFMNYPSLPEAHDAAVVISTFFDKQLAR
jgi:monoterpene epsilon-lactone hydrolase